MKLRPYQETSIKMTYEWLQNNDGNPCLVLPTGSGKSVIIAEFIKRSLQSYPESHFLMLTHMKELIEQNAKKMLAVWPDAPLGIYSASIGKRQLGEPITFAGIQSVRNRASDIEFVDVIIIDECHLCSHEEKGGYRTLINDLKAINPKLRVIGLTATPYRLGYGLITGESALFDGLIEPVSVLELIDDGYLSPLRSKLTHLRIDASDVKKRGGEFIESELQKAVNTTLNNYSAVDEVVRLGANRKAWLFFCVGVDHAHEIKRLLTNKGIIAETITGATPKKERERIIAEYQAGKITAITNANVLTTGFDYEEIDLIAFLRPTMSLSLYVQMAGRGMRIAEGKDDCLILDFAGLVSTHGPITELRTPTQSNKIKGDAPTKNCPQCAEIVSLSAKACPCCGFEFPPPDSKDNPLRLREDDIMGIEGSVMFVESWHWAHHVSRASGNDMIKVTYYGCLSDPPITEYFPIYHDGYAQIKARRTIDRIVTLSKCVPPNVQGSTSEHEIIEALAGALNEAFPPCAIEYKKDGNFYRVLSRDFDKCTNLDQLA